MEDESAVNSMPHIWRAPIGWPVAGLWASRALSSGAGLDADAQREVETAQSSPSAELCAFGDGIGRVSMMRFPAPARKVQMKAYHGHGSRVTHVCWAADNFLMSTAMEDGVMLQWRVTTEKPQQASCVIVSDSPAHVNDTEEAAPPLSAR